MKEIKEKDLEKAAGGRHSVVSQGCDSFEERVPGFGFSRQCAYCKYFVGTKGGGGVCSLEQPNQGE